MTPLAWPRLLLAIYAAMQMLLPQQPAQPPKTPQFTGDDPSHPYDGYFDHFGQWVPGMINNATWYRSAPQHTTGSAVFYAPGIMEATARMRGQDLTGYLDGVAMMSPADIGEIVWLKRPNSKWEGPYLVVDCARRGDMYSAIYYRGEVVEVGFQTALRWEMAAGKPGSWRALIWRQDEVQVWKGYRPPENGQAPIDYPAWWLQRIEFTYGWEKRPVHNSWPSPVAPRPWYDQKLLRWADVLQ